MDAKITDEGLKAILGLITPGPWQDRKHWSDDEKREVAPTYDGPPDIGPWTEIAEVSGHGDDSEVQAIANAELIALAPDLASEVLELRAQLASRYPPSLAS